MRVRPKLAIVAHSRYALGFRAFLIRAIPPERYLLNLFIVILLLCVEAISYEEAASRLQNNFLIDDTTLMIFSIHLSLFEICRGPLKGRSRAAIAGSEI
jgi:hypothetical protein